MATTYPGVSYILTLTALIEKGKQKKTAITFYWEISQCMGFPCAVLDTAERGT
jgi:hypothetical protein